MLSWKGAKKQASRLSGAPASCWEIRLNSIQSIVDPADLLLFILQMNFLQREYPPTNYLQQMFLHLLENLPAPVFYEVGC